MHIKKIMIIDDNKIDRWLLRKTLSKVASASEVIEVETAVEALNVLTATTREHLRLPELIFLDMNMPVLSGMEFLEVFDGLLPASEHDGRIIITCSVYDPVEKRNAFKYDFVIGYYMKPLNEEILLQIRDLRRHNTAS